FLYDSDIPYIYTLSLHDALPISSRFARQSRFAWSRWCRMQRVHRYRSDFREEESRESARNPGDVPHIRKASPNPRGQAYFAAIRSEEHTSELQSPYDLVCRLLLE